MASLQENLELLKNIATNPKKQLDHYIAAGKKVVGCFPVYTPEVMVHAAGMIPMGLWGAQTEITQSRNYLPPFACPIMQSCMELGLNGTYDGISCVMIPAMCDTFRCITQDWKTGVTSIPCIPFTFPQNRVMEESVTYLIDEYTYVKNSIEKYCDVTITEEAMQTSIAVYNHHMSVMNTFCTIANEHLDIIDAVTRHAVMKSATFMDKAEHAAIVEEIIDALKAEPVCDWKDKKWFSPVSLLNQTHCFRCLLIIKWLLLLMMLLRNHASTAHLFQHVTLPLKRLPVNGRTEQATLLHTTKSLDVQNYFSILLKRTMQQVLSFA